MATNIIIYKNETKNNTNFYNYYYNYIKDRQTFIFICRCHWTGGAFWNIKTVVSCLKTILNKRLLITEKLINIVKSEVVHGNVF